MKIRVPDYFDRFSCIADRCPDTCCQGWAIVVDDDSYQRYRTLPGEIGARLRDALHLQDGEYTITCRQDGRCSMLDDDGLCSLQKACGPQALCRVCDQFPRFSTDIGQHRELGLSLSCPEAARLILTQAEPVTFHTDTTPEPVTICHDVDAAFYFGLRQARGHLISLLQNRAVPLEQRVLQVNALCSRLQRTQGRFSRRSIQQVLDAAASIPAAGKPGPRQRRAILQQLMQRQPRRADWHTRLQTVLAAPAPSTDQYTAFSRYCSDWSILQEQLLVYFLNKYLIRAAFDGDILGAARYCLASWALVYELALQEWLQHGVVDWLTLAYQYAAETENDESCHIELSGRLRRLSQRNMQALLTF